VQLRFPAPRGLAVEPQRAPELYALIDELSHEFPGARLDEVRLTPDWSLELARVPASGYPYAWRRCLLLGVPTLLGSSPTHMRIHIAHALARLSRIYTRPSGWVTLLADLWSRHREAHAEGLTPPQMILRAFFGWYAPLYALIAAPAQRAEVLRADERVLAVSNDLDIREAIVTGWVMRRLLEGEYWPSYLKLASRHAHPPYPPYAHMARSLPRGVDRKTAARWLETAMEDYVAHGSHGPTPSLAERLVAIGHERVGDIGQVEPVAAQTLLGGHLVPILNVFDTRWLAANKTEWAARYARTEGEKQRLSELERQAELAPLAGEEAWEYVRLVARYHDATEVTLRYKTLLTGGLDHARASFYIGRYLLAQRDPEGVRALERAMALDEGHTVSACRLITRYMVETGAKRFAQFYRRKALAYEAHAA
jgi:hypothetical protein